MTLVQKITMFNRQRGAIPAAELSALTGAEPWTVAITLLRLQLYGLASLTDGGWLVTGGTTI